MSDNMIGRPALGTGRRRLLLIVALFAFPFAGAVILYSAGWRPVGAVNYGELVQPPVPVLELGLRTVAGDVFDESPFAGQWALVIALSGPCDESCRDNLYKTRQVRLALGKDVDRVRRVLLLATEPGDSLLSWTMDDHPDLLLARTIDPKTPFDTDGGVRVVDPLGNLMLSYPRDGDAQGMLKDMKRLLKLSGIG